MPVDTAKKMSVWHIYINTANIFIIKDYTFYNLSVNLHEFHDPLKWQSYCTWSSEGSTVYKYDVIK